MGAIDIEEAERVLGQSRDHRILLRVPPVAEWRLAAPEGVTRRALFVDIKTTGPSLEADQVMEIGALAFDYDLRSGVIGAVDEPVMFEDPDPSDLNAFARESHLVIAHDAAFVRPMVENAARRLRRRTGPARSPRLIGRAKVSLRSGWTIFSCGLAGSMTDSMSRAMPAQASS